VGFKSAVGKGILDGLEAAKRLQRAKEQGYGEQVWYHGTNQDISSFDPRYSGDVTRHPSTEGAVFMAARPDHAGDYAIQAARVTRRNKREIAEKLPELQRRQQAAEARGDWEEYERLELEWEELELGDATTGGENIMPLVTSANNPYVWEAGVSSEDMLQAFDNARRLGHDSVLIKNSVDTMGGLPPGDHLAVFDPSNIRSPNAQFDPSKSGSSKILAGTGGAAIGAGLLSEDAEAGPMGTISKMKGIPTRQVHHGSPHDFPPMAKVRAPEGLPESIRSIQAPNGEMYVTLADAKAKNLEIIEEYPQGRFSTAKIGTGEGAQAYGHGLYFTSKEEIARFYRDALSDSRMEYEGFDNATDAKQQMGYDFTWEFPDDNLDAHMATAYVDHAEHALWRGLNKEQAIAAEGPERVITGKLTNHQLVGRAYDDLKKLNPKKVEEGKLYRAEIPDESLMLDWDKPLSEQPEKIREVFAKADHGEADSWISAYETADEATWPLGRLAEKWADNTPEQQRALIGYYQREGMDVPKQVIERGYIGSLPDEARPIAERMLSGPQSARTGDASQADWDELYRLAPDADHNQIHDIADNRQELSGQSLYQSLGDDVEASAQLRELGIPGITYKGATSNERNFVVFDDEMINLIEKGMIDPRLLAPLAGAGGAGAYAVSEFSEAESALSASREEIQTMTDDFNRRRAEKRDIWDHLRGLGEAGLAMGSGMVGGVVGDLSRISGYMNPYMDPAATEAGAEALQGMIQYEPSPAAIPYLEPLGQGIETFTEDIERGIDQIPLPVRESANAMWDQLPERSKGLIKAVGGIAL